MSEQKFFASPATKFTYPNGAIAFGPGGPFDCLGHFAKVKNCPIGKTNLRLTCYATNYADTFFSVPAVTRYHGKRVTGYFSVEDENIVFNFHNCFNSLFGV